ncbi:hypothetical protein [uncultured Dysgonomonas sp.]|uniref:Lipoprotein n=1 Tax=uncultured Dysgonomonas sp. TaxID=206096 RepID=A0A212JLE1_9BACT|nr:hypothetical protein [uncultured Dysgonomonas sp.]SBW00242.1 conserved hypothetical protein [uncultured Dysgonomonas sp.]
MIRLIIPTITICLLSYACSSPIKKDSPETNTDKPAEKIENIPAMIPSHNGMIRLNVVNGKGKVAIQKKKDQIIYVEFESKGYKKITAQLFTTDSLANIRFSQITLPNGSMDGPFDRNLSYSIPSDGICKLSIHENMMAGDPWGGIMEVEVSLTK